MNILMKFCIQVLIRKIIIIIIIIIIILHQQLFKIPRTDSIVNLTNLPPFSIVCTLICHRNDTIKCSKLKWNREPLGE